MIATFELAGFVAWVLLLLVAAAGLVALAVGNVDRGEHGRFAWHLPRYDRDFKPRHSGEYPAVTT